MLRLRHFLGAAGALSLLVLSGMAHGEPEYTRHPPDSGATRTIPVYLDPRWVSWDAEAIASAIAEWNHVLNGRMRLEVLPLPFPPGAERDMRTWTILRSPGKEGVRETGRSETSLASVQPLPLGGGVLLVFDGALKYFHDHPIGLRDVMMRELGHLAGLRHDQDTSLLAEPYRRGDASCIDKATASTVAARLGVAVEALNWCERAR